MCVIIHTMNYIISWSRVVNNLHSPRARFNIIHYREQGTWCAANDNCEYYMQVRMQEAFGRFVVQLLFSHE